MILLGLEYHESSGMTTLILNNRPKLTSSQAKRVPPPDNTHFSLMVTKKSTMNHQHKTHNILLSSHGYHVMRPPQGHEFDLHSVQECTFMTINLSLNSKIREWKTGQGAGNSFYLFLPLLKTVHFNRGNFFLLVCMAPKN